jgi:NAD-dependent dihydropyrimidine dehydrogenase PreA subunit
VADADGTFIEVDVSGEAATDPEIARKLEEVCPVDIFKAGDAGVEVVRGNLDECVLCELCLEAAPAGTVVVKKLYDGTELRR